MPTFKEAMFLACIAAAYGFVSQFDADRPSGHAGPCPCPCQPRDAMGIAPAPGQPDIPRVPPQEGPPMGADPVSPDDGAPACACNRAGAIPPRDCSAAARPVSVPTSALP